MSDVYNQLARGNVISGIAGLGQAGAGIAGTIIGAITNKKNREAQAELLDYQKNLQKKIFEREDTAYQRAVQDALAAGLSPSVVNGSGTAGAGSVVSTSAPMSDPSYAIGGLSQLSGSTSQFINGLTAFSKMHVDKSTTEKQQADIQLAIDTLEQNALQFEKNLETMISENQLDREQAERLQNSQQVHEMNKLAKTFSHEMSVIAEKYSNDKKMLQTKLSQEWAIFLKEFNQRVFENNQRHSEWSNEFTQNFVAREQDFQIKQGNLELDKLKYDLQVEVEQFRMTMEEAAFILDCFAQVSDTVVDVSQLIQNKKARELQEEKSKNGGSHFSIGDFASLVTTLGSLAVKMM